MTRHAPRRDVRHPRRRQGPDLPAPRERDRAVARRRRRRHVRALLDAQRLPQLRRREDVEVARQRLQLRSDRATRSAARRCASSASSTTTARRSTSRSRSVDGDVDRQRTSASGSSASRPPIASSRSSTTTLAKHRRRSSRRVAMAATAPSCPRPRSSCPRRATRSPTTSTRRWSSPRCTTRADAREQAARRGQGHRQAGAPPHARAARQATCAPSVPRSACSRRTRRTYLRRAREPAGQDEEDRRRAPSRPRSPSARPPVPPRISRAATRSATS